MFDLKADPNFPHHYIIGVAMRDMKSHNPGEFFLKYGPVYFHHDLIIDIQNAAMLSTDKVFKTTSKEAADAFGCREFIASFHGLRMAANANMATLHHFSSEFELVGVDEFFTNFVKEANTNGYVRSKLLDAKIRGY
jgi:hypothetical protein